MCVCVCVCDVLCGPRDNLASVRVAKKIQFFDDHWSAGRIITSMDWSNNVHTHTHTVV